MAEEWRWLGVAAFVSSNSDIIREYDIRATRKETGKRGP
jgi:hypothetical protein